MTSTPPARPNPYPGPRAFQRDESLYGRDREVMELLDLLIAERIVLLYSPSGAGKTSLIQAALIPRLEEEGFRVLPIMRASLEPPPGAGLPAKANRYMMSLLLSLEEALPPEQQTPLAELAGLTLGDYLDRRSAAAAGADSIVLILDQFEEVLTVDPTDREAKAEFFAQVGAALRDRRRWALFAMREEYVAGLDPYLAALPTRLSTTYRLELLGVAEAKEAMQRPARAAGVEFTAAAAKRLAGDLAAVRIQQPDGSTSEVTGDYVEPVQLQVVCRRLRDRLPPGDAEIGVDDVESVGDVDAALRAYYADQVASVAAQTGVAERAIRDWVDRQLITDQGIRGQVLEGKEQSQGLATRAVWPLVDAHLLRAEKRRGATWFELAHDRLVEPVRADNAAWRQAHLGPLQRQAALWKEQGQGAGLLLRGQALADAEAWAAAHGEEVSGVDKDFLDACRQAQAIARRENRQRGIIGCLAWVALIVGVVAIGLGIYAGSKARSAQAAATEVALANLTAESSLYEAQTAESNADSERQRALIAASAEATAKLGAEANLREAQTAEAQAATAEQQAVDSQATVAALLGAVLTLQAPTATPTPSPTPTLSPGYKVHIVRAGDTFVSIAQRYDLSPYDLARANNLSLTGRLDVGTILRIPPSTAGTYTPTVAPRFSPTPTATPTPNQAATAAAESTVQAVATQFAQVQATQTAMARPSPSPTRPSPSRTPTPAPPPAVPTLDAARGRIAYVSWQDNSNEILIMNGDGAQQNRLTRNDVDDLDPALSGDGRYIVFVSSRDGDQEIYVMTSVGSGASRLTSSPGQDRWPAFSPDGKTIVFASSRAGNDEIYLMDLDGRNQRSLSRNGASDRDPAFSPDGRQIVFVSDRDGNDELYIMDVDGRNVRRLTTSPGKDWEPCVSPDGSQVLYVYDGDGNQEIYLLDLSSLASKRLTRNSEDDRDPAFAPDGSQIVYTSNHDGIWNLFVMNPDGSGAQRVTKDLVDYSPSWSVVPSGQ